MHSRVSKWVGMLGLWAAIGFILSVEVYFNVRATKPDVAFWSVAESQYARALLWALLAPFVLWLRERVPLRRGRWFGGMAVHLAASVFIMVAYYLMRTAWAMHAEGQSLGAFWAVARANFFGRNLIDVVLYWAVLGCGYTIEIHRRFRNEEVKAAQLESRLIEAELRALKQQLQPHFLFNAMNTIAVLVREERNAEAVNLIARLSQLLRMSLDRTRLPEVTLRQEMEFLERYIEIQKVRFADRLTVRTAIAPEALDARIPNFLLQPIVENAILHGVAPKCEPGTIEVSGRVRDGRLHLEVRDNGVGFEVTEGSRASEGIGLGNTRARLARIYGDHGRLMLTSARGAGTTVRIVLPCRTGGGFGGL